MATGENVLATVQEQQFPPNDWWSERIHPDIVSGLRTIYRAYEIDCRPLWQAADKLSRSAPRQRVNLSTEVLGCMYVAATPIVEEMETEDTATMAGAGQMAGSRAKEGTPAPAVSNREGFRHTPGAPAAARPIPPGTVHRENPVFSNGRTGVAVNAARSLQSALENVSDEGGGMAHANASRAPLAPLAPANVSLFNNFPPAAAQQNLIPVPGSMPLATEREIVATAGLTEDQLHQRAVDGRAQWIRNRNSSAVPSSFQQQRPDQQSVMPTGNHSSGFTSNVVSSAGMAPDLMTFDAAPIMPHSLPQVMQQSMGAIQHQPPAGLAPIFTGNPSVMALSGPSMGNNTGPAQRNMSHSHTVSHENEPMVVSQMPRASTAAGPNGGQPVLSTHHDVNSESTSTPTGQTGNMRRANSSPALQLSRQLDVDRAKGNQRKYMEGLKLRFDSNTYLGRWKASVMVQMNKCNYIPEDEKASMLLTMLTNVIRDRVQSRMSTDTPSSMDQIWTILHSLYPANPAELQLKMQNFQMEDNETASAFVQRAFDLYRSCQVDLPTKHSGMVAIYMKSSTFFIKHMSELNRLRKSLMRSEPGGVTQDYDYSWTEFQTAAHEFDMECSMYNNHRSSRNRRDAKLVSENVTTASRTRSGARFQSKTPKSAAVSVNASDAETDHRGRSRERNGPDDRGRSQSRHSSVGRYSNRDDARSRSPFTPGGSKRYPSKSPRHTDAGRTPFQQDRPRTNRIDLQAQAAKGGDANVSAAVPGLFWIRAHIMHTAAQCDISMAHEADPSPIVISTLPNSPARHNGAAVMAGAVSRRPNNPEPIASEDMEADAPDLVNTLPEAMRRGLRHVSNLPTSNPYAKLLNAQFMLTFRQLAGMVQDEDFSSICKQLLELGMQREGRQYNAAQTQAAAAILRLALAELPVFRTPVGARPVDPAPLLGDAIVSAAQTCTDLKLPIAGMFELTAHIDEACKRSRWVKLDSGASISCISTEALEADGHHLIKRGKLQKLSTPMTVSGFASAHTRITQVLVNARLTIGKVACTQTFLVVPGLICNYLLGQDFMLTYNMRIDPQIKKAIMIAPTDEWIGKPEEHTGSQSIDVSHELRLAQLKICPQ